MSRFGLVVAFVLAGLWLAQGSGAAQGGETGIPLPPVRIGDQFPYTFDVRLPAGAVVEVDTASPAWGPVTVVRIDSIALRGSGTPDSATITVTLAAFSTGDLSFRPAVLVITGTEAQALELPPVSLPVVSTLGPLAPLELSPLSPPRGIAGAQPVWVIPSAIVGALLAAGILFWLVRRLARWLASRPRRSPLAAEDLLPVPDLAGAAAQLETDPVAAYRTLASTVRAALAARYGFPARALTTAELERRMELEGIDRWQARLVGGLLEECDAVVYAGYRPASERRLADLNMAHEILEAG